MDMFHYSPCRKLAWWYDIISDRMDRQVGMDRKWFKVKRETLEKQKEKIDKYGPLLALLAWLPIIGDVFAIALGFYKTKPLLSAIFMLIGRAIRFLIWIYIIPLF